jgi:hypothetical protein
MNLLETLLRTAPLCDERERLSLKTAQSHIFFLVFRACFDEPAGSVLELSAPCLACVVAMSQMARIGEGLQCE